jgi:hypothetical protein
MTEEANKLWGFFQRFIDEQAIDQLKIIRSKDAGINLKLFGVEWFARYCELITPDSILLAASAFKDIYQSADKFQRDKYFNHVHHSEGIVTILKMIRNLKNKIDGKQMEIETYD